MTESEQIQYKILLYLSQQYVNDNKITEEIILNQFKDIDKEQLNKNWWVLKHVKAVGSISSNNDWKITYIGEKELSRIQTNLDIEKNLKATLAAAKSVEKIQLEQTERLIFLNRLMVIGVLIAAVYYLLEILKIIYCFFCGC